MTVDEPTRHELFSWFAEQMPERLAEAMMKSIPPTGWGDVATRNDLTANAVLLRGEMAEVRGAMSELRGEMHAFKSEVRGEMHAFKSEVRGEIGALRKEIAGEMGSLRTEVEAGRSGMTRTVVLATAASTASTWGVVLAAIGLG